MTHTPTPWKVYQFGGVQVGQDDTGEAICSMWGDKHEGEANAAHIVKCVNLHDELVAIAMTAFKMIDDPVHWSVANPHAGGFDEDKLRETLKKAGAL